MRRGLALLAFIAMTMPAWLAPPATAAADPVIAAAGDIACDPSTSNWQLGSTSGCRARAVSDLLGSNGVPSVAAILPLGDNQYYCGGLSAFQTSYADSWGRFNSVTKPAVGNHEYLSSGGTGCDPTATAAGYYTYFASQGVPTSTPGQTRQGFYSYDIGTWHLVSLNSNCTPAGGCGTTSPQYKWLDADLAAHPTTCTLAYWHIPVWSSGGRANSNMSKITQLLYARGVDVVLTGHDHIYERFAPQNGTGGADPNGIRAWVVGTGGANHTSIATVAPNSQVRDTKTFGVLRLTLHPTGYDWQFVPAVAAGNGAFTDSGSGTCH